MKAQILKIAGVKSEKEFYKKYPSEEAFMKVHSKAFKKAQMGTAINKAQGGINVDNNGNGIPDYLEYNQTNNNSYTGTSNIPQQFGSGIRNSNFGPQNNPNPIRNTLPNAPIAQEEIYNPSTQSGLSTYTPTAQDVITKNQGITGGMPTGDVSKAAGAAGGIGSYMGAATDIIGGIQGLSKQKEEKNKMRQARKVTDLQALASGTREEKSERRYNTPWDNPLQANQMFPTYGVGTNVITRNGGSIQRAQYGTQISGNPTEIQNTYDPYDIYSDGGYEPLNDSDVKQYYDGGYIQQAQDGGGFSNFMTNQGGGQALGNITNMFSNNSAESQIGKGIGTAAGTAFGGPVGGMIGGAIGNIAGGMLNTSQKSIKRDQNAINRNIGTMVGNATGQGLQAQYSSYVKNGGDIPSYEEGGYMNPEYNPQVITMFGDHNAQDFADYAHKDQYRAGGHLKAYTPPSDRAMEIYEDGGGIKSHGLGGELQIHWGGGAETISHNPYLPGTGETVMFRGKSHEEYSPNGETGIGVTYGGNPVEVERREPMVELEEGGVVDPMTGEVQKSGVVFGNLKIPNQYIDMLGDKNAKGKKFKNYVNDLSKIESKQNKVVEKATNELNGFVPQNSFDKLKLSALQASIQGANMKLKSIADKKINAASLQNAINDTAEENGLVADDLARGKVKIDKEAMQTREARWGDAISKAAEGKTVTTETTKPPKMTTAEAIKQGYKKDESGIWKRKTKATSATTAQSKSATAMEKIPFQNVDKETGLSKKITPQQLQEYKKKNSWYPNWDTFDPKNPEEVDKYAKAFNARAKEIGSTAQILSDKNTPGKTSIVGEQFVSANFDDSAKTTPPSSGEEYAEIEDPEAVPEKNKFNWMNIVNAAIPYFRPTDQEGLDPNQLSGEMYALSSNQLEPVPAQGFQPDLGVPYDISLQDQLNANQSDYRAAQRMMGYNPAAQANLNAQKYQANQQVLGEQFRANQAMKDKVYGENRNILNDAKLKNLAIYDQQYGRQAEALSNTKATTQAALSSIADKYAKNKLENRELGVYENMYNYRFDNDGRAVNMNPLAQFNMEGRGTSSKSSGKGLAEGKGFTYDENGNIVGVRSIGKEDNVKNGKKISAKNGSIVKSYKNI